MLVTSPGDYRMALEYGEDAYDWMRPQASPVKALISPGMAYEYARKAGHFARLAVPSLRESAKGIKP